MHTNMSRYGQDGLNRIRELEAEVERLREVARSKGTPMPVDRTPGRDHYEDAERVARAFHEAYERLAPTTGYRTREESAKPWDNIPPANRMLMVNTVLDLLQREVIRV